MQTAVTMLRPFPEQKALIYFGSGLRLNGTDNTAQLRATTNAAIRSNVTIHPVDARGLVATPPLGDATQQTLQEIWNGGAYRSFREALLSDRPPGACANCGLRWSL